MASDTARSDGFEGTSSPCPGGGNPSGAQRQAKVSDDAKARRRISERLRTIGQDFAAEQSLPAPLPAEGFDPGRVLNPWVDRFPLITVRSPSVRCRCGSSTARFGSPCRRCRVRIFEFRTLRATHARTSARGGQCAKPCHYLAILECRPRGLPGSTALMQTR